MKTRKAIPYKDLGTAGEDTPWSGPKEMAAAEVEDLRIMSAWVDAEGGDAKEDFKLAHHRVTDKKAVWRGVKAAMGALLGARGGVDIPSADRRSVYNHLSKHYTQFEKDAPSFRSDFMKEPERRYIAASELRADVESNEIFGYGARFGTYSDNLGFFKEKIRKGAFAKTIKENDIRSLFNHDPNYLLARTRNGTLELEEDDKGLMFNAKLPDTSYAQDLLVNIQNKNITQNSFGFKTLQDAWSKDGSKRELIEVELFDVGPVTFPAYPQTSVKVRTMMYDYGIQYDELAQLMIKQDNQRDLTKKDVDLLESTIEILRSIIPEGMGEPGAAHSSVSSEEEPVQDDMATLTRLRLITMRLEDSKILN